MEDQQKLIEDLFERGILVSKDVLDKKVDALLSDNVIGKLEQERDLLVLNTDYVDIVTKQRSLVDWYEIDSLRVHAEKERDDELYQAQLQRFKQAELQVRSSDPDFNKKQQLNSLETEMNFTSESLSSETHFSNLLDSPAILTSSPELTPIILSPSKVYIVISYQNEARKFEVKDFTLLFASRYKFLESILR